MSISTLFNNNNYTIKCRNLECKELIAGDIVNPTAIIDDLYTDRIRSGQTQAIVINLGGALDPVLFDKIVAPNNPIGGPNLDLGGSTADRRWGVVHSNSINTGVVNSSSASIGTIEANTVDSENGIRFGPALPVGFSNQLAVYITGSANLVPGGAWLGTGNREFFFERIGDIVHMSIISGSNVETVSAAPISFSGVPEYFHPSSEVAFAIFMDIDNARSICECVIGTNGVVTIYDGLNSANFPNTTNVRFGYTGPTTKATFTYRI